MNEFDLTGQRLAVYTRSLDTVPSGLSWQEALCADFVTQCGGTIARHFADVKVSGAYPALPGLAALQQASVAGAIDCIVVGSSDRIMGHRAQWEYLRAICASGVEVFSATEGYSVCSILDVLSLAKPLSASRSGGFTHHPQRGAEGADQQQGT